MLTTLESHITGIRDAELSKMFVYAAESLDLTSTQFADAESKYKAVGAFLSEPGSLLAWLNPVIWPHGSLALGTAVKPLGRSEFDLDSACEMLLPANVSQLDAKLWVGVRLRQSKVYSDMLEEMNRCWRLNYAGQFHLDVLPAKPDSRILKAILVPDKALRDWKESNPQGYAGWFRFRCYVTALVLHELSAANAMASVEPLPIDGKKPKLPLQRAIQLLKRHRDVTYAYKTKEEKAAAPISIIITTLAAHAYQGEADVLSTMQNIVRRMPSHVRYVNGKAYILNPTNPDENFAEKWHTHPEREEAFKAWIRKADQDLQQLRLAVGFNKIGSILDRFLGPNRRNIVFKHFIDEMESKRQSGLRVDLKTVTLGVAAGPAVLKNTFYGDPE